MPNEAVGCPGSKEARAETAFGFATPVCRGARTWEYCRCKGTESSVTPPRRTVFARLDADAGTCQAPAVRNQSTAWQLAVRFAARIECY